MTVTTDKILTHIQIQRHIQIQIVESGIGNGNIDVTIVLTLIVAILNPNLLGASLTATLLNVNYTPITQETRNN